MSEPAARTLIWTDTEALTLRDLVRYAGASGDFNPIHYDNDFAKSRGLPSIIVHGMFSTGIVARLVRAHAARPFQFNRINVRFLSVLVPYKEIEFTCWESADSVAPLHRLIVEARQSNPGRPAITCAVEIADL